MGIYVYNTLAFLALVGIGLYYLFQELRRPVKVSSNRTELAFTILKKRYASGEITREEYLKMKEDLQ